MSKIIHARKELYSYSSALMISLVLDRVVYDNSLCDFLEQELTSVFSFHFKYFHNNNNSIINNVQINIWI